MKKITLTLVLLFTNVALSSDLGAISELPGGFTPPGLGNPELFPVEEDPGPTAEIVEEVVHEKILSLDNFVVRLKWTPLGYGQMTEKVIVPELAKHTVFNHRNPGEEGPCLRSFRTFGQEELNHEGGLEVSIKILNSYVMNRERKICQVNLVEDVRTTIDGVEFSHVYTKPMGYRYIGDCPQEI